MSDCTAPPKNCPITALRRPAQPRTWLMGSMGLALGTLIVLSGGFAFLRGKPPVTILSSEIITPSVYPDGYISFFVRAVTSIDRACTGSVTREFYTYLQIEGRSVRRKRRDSGAPPIAHADETEYVIDVPLPAKMDPGRWEFQGETTYDCGIAWAIFHDFPGGLTNGGVIRLRTPIMSFEILEPPSLDRK